MTTALRSAPSKDRQIGGVYIAISREGKGRQAAGRAPNVSQLRKAPAPADARCIVSSFSHPQAPAGCDGQLQIRRLRCASSRARLRVPSVSATLRLAASSVLIVSRADIILDDLIAAATTTGGASGVFMVLIGILLSGKMDAGTEATQNMPRMAGSGALNRSIGLAAIRKSGPTPPASGHPVRLVR